MGNILAAIEHSAITTVEEGGMLWKVRKICSSDLARVGHAALAMAQGFESNPESDGGDDDVGEKMAAAPLEQLQTMATLKDAVVAAGLMAVGDPDSGEWENVKPTLDRDKSNAAKGVIWIGSLPGSVSDVLFAEIMSLSTDGGAALERLRSFREEPGDAPDSRPNRKKVRRSAK